jgi:hypothetical protein
MEVSEALQFDYRGVSDLIRSRCLVMSGLALQLWIALFMKLRFAIRVSYNPIRKE